MNSYMLTVAALLAAGDADPLPQQLQTLRDLLSAGQLAQAAVAARTLEGEVAARAPLQITEGKVLLKPAEGLGIYDAAPQGVVRGEEIFLYAEVRGHGLKRTSKGYGLHLVSDLIVLDAAGKQELARDDAFGQSKFEAAAPHRDTFVNIALRAAGLPAGRYTMRLVITDKVSGKTGQVDIPMQIP